MTFFQTNYTVMWYALGVVRTPRRPAPCAFYVEFEDLLGWTVVFEQFGPNPLAKVLNLLCFLVRRRAETYHLVSHDITSPTIDI